MRRPTKTGRESTESPRGACANDRGAAVDRMLAALPPEGRALAGNLDAETWERASGAVSRLLLGAAGTGGKVVLRTDGSLAIDGREYLSAAEVAQEIAWAADLWENPSAPLLKRVPDERAARLTRLMPVAAGCQPRLFEQANLVRLVDDGFLMEGIPPHRRISNLADRWNS